MSPWPHDSTQIGGGNDVDTLRQQIDYLTEVNRRLLADCQLLRQKVDLLRDESTEQAMLRLEGEIATLSSANQVLVGQMEREREIHQREITRLQVELQTAEDLVAHQYARLKELFKAGLTGGEPVQTTE